MAWVAPRTWISMELASAAALNQELRDNANAIARPAYVRLSGPTPAIVATATQQALTRWTVEHVDTDAWHVAGAPAVIAKSKRVVVARLALEWAAAAGSNNIVGSRLDFSFAAGFRYVEDRQTPVANQVWWSHCTHVHEARVNEYFTPWAYHETGANRNLLSGRLEACALGVW